jgi:GTP cyclohydrolase I
MSQNSQVIEPLALTNEAVQSIIRAFDSDPENPDLLETPHRYIKFINEFRSLPEVKYTTFDGEGYNEMIIQSDIPFYSICEHHLIPFFGQGTIAYIPDKEIVGLSKLARTLEFASRRLQNQERITMQVASKLTEVLNPKGVAVTLKARHMCMEMRGIRKLGTMTTTSHLTGFFKTRPETRAEYLDLIK